MDTAKKKPQNLNIFEKPNKINGDQINVVKYSEEYLAYFSKEDFELIKQTIKDLKISRNIVHYDTQGLTQDNCLVMCKEYDVVAIEKTKEKEEEDPTLNKKTKIQHPLSKDQQAKNEKNKYKMKQENHNKKTSKNNLEE